MPRLNINFLVLILKPKKLKYSFTFSPYKQNWATAPTNYVNYIINKIKNENINNVRIDTHKDNISMQTFLNKKGFIHCGEISITCDFNDLPSLREAFMRQL